MAKKQARPNPLTGQPPNEFTQVTNRELPSAKAVRPFVPRTKNDPTGSVTGSGNPKQVPDRRAEGLERRRLTAQVQGAKSSGAVDAPVGYRPPEGMAQGHFSWLMGAHHMLPNDSRGPAINEPHEGSSAVTVQRRAEDLSGSEYAKGAAVLRHYGHGENPVASLTDHVRRQTNRVLAEHVRAGTEESASQLFYGGSVKTEIPENPALDSKHYTDMRRTPGELDRHTNEVAASTQLQEYMPGASHHERRSAARSMMIQATADTSPNSKYRENDTFPNLAQARESVDAAIDKRPAKFITGRTPNEEKASNRVGQMLDTGNHDIQGFGDPGSAPKTVAFKGALADHTSPDAFTVSDVHHASILTQGLSTAKSLMHRDTNDKNVRVHADAPPGTRRGLTPRIKPGTDKVVKSLSRPEEMLDKGKPYVHALADRAQREVLTESGLSRGVHYADNVHSLQAALWGSQQVTRPDVNVSHANQYPVVRDWGAEGHDNLTAQGRTVFGSREGMGRQFRENPNTSNTDNPKRKPYDVMPGD